MVGALAKGAALPPQRDKRGVRLTGRGRRARLSSQGEAQTEIPVYDPQLLVDKVRHLLSAA